MPHSPRSTTGSGRTYFPIGCKAAMCYSCIDMHIARSRSPIKCRKRPKRTCGGVISLAPRRAPHAFDSGTTLTSCPEYDPYLQHVMNSLKHHYHQQHSHNMRGFRGQGQAYMPPHASDRAGPLQAARTLGDIEFPTLYWQVELQGATSRLSYEGCPAQLASNPAKDGNSVAGDMSGRTMLLLSDASNDEVVDELLEWFQQEACESSKGPQQDSIFGPCLKLPCHISKEQRAHWHKMAQAKGLKSESQGVGNNRQLHIMCPTADHIHSGLSKRAKQVWEWCQMEGGRMWSISQGEVQAMLQDGGHIPTDVQHMINRREQGRQLAQLLQTKNADAAIEMLSTEPSLAWVRDDESGGYPLHIAVWHDLRPAVTKILLVPNVTEQRDGRRDTPLMLAWKRGHADVASMLLAAGATDLPSCSPVVGCKGQDRPYSSKTQPARSASNRSRSYAHSPQPASSAVQRPPGLGKKDASDRWDGPPGFNR